MELPQSSAIYVIINLLTGERYIGATTNAYKRWNWHRAKLRCRDSGIPKLQEAWDAHGEQAFRFVIVQEVENKADLSALETEYIARFEPEYNIKQRSSLGKNHGERKFSEEQIERMRQAHAYISDETREKMRAAKLGKAPMAATRAAAEKARGKTRSPEVIEKIKAGQRARWERRKAELLANAKRDEQGRFSEK